MIKLYAHKCMNCKLYELQKIEALIKMKIKIFTYIQVYNGSQSLTIQNKNHLNFRIERDIKYFIFQSQFMYHRVQYSHYLSPHVKAGCPNRFFLTEDYFLPLTIYFIWLAVSSSNLGLCTFQEEELPNPVDTWKKKKKPI